MVERHRILAEIRRTAKENGGKPLGIARFADETGIRQADWFGKHWTRWGDALHEAGFARNLLQEPHDKELLLDALVALIRELRAFPTEGDVRLKRRRDPSFPGASAFTRRLGSKKEWRSKLEDYCRARDGMKDVLEILAQAATVTAAAPSDGRDESASKSDVGFVYLLRHGSRNQYKIGKTKNPIRREGEVRVELPEKVAPIHVIKTDDPSGIEAYWHARFASKRMNGEWFALSPEDVRAFKKWQRIS